MEDEEEEDVTSEALEVGERCSECLFFKSMWKIGDRGRVPLLQIRISKAARDDESGLRRCTTLSRGFRGYPKRSRR